MMNQNIDIVLWQLYNVKISFILWVPRLPPKMFLKFEDSFFQSEIVFKTFLSESRFSICLEIHLSDDEAKFKAFFFIPLPIFLLLTSGKL